MNSSHFLRELFFDPEDPIYGDHFPGRPVVPGSVILEGMLRGVQTWDSSLKIKGIEGFRFKRFVAPGGYQMILERLGDRVHCQLRDEGQTLVTGVVLLCD